MIIFLIGLKNNVINTEVTIPLKVLINPDRTRKFLRTKSTYEWLFSDHRHPNTLDKKVHSEGGWLGTTGVTLWPQEWSDFEQLKTISGSEVWSYGPTLGCQSGYTR